MNKLFFIIFLIGFNCYSQIGIIGFQQKLTGGIINDSIPPEPEPIDNMLFEKDYFDAYYLPIEDKASIQTALNTYGSVRLGKGNYSGTSFTMSGNMKLYGHPSVTQVSNITINGDSDGLLISSIKNGSITISSGKKVQNSTFHSIKESIITTTGGIIENNTFLDNSRTRIMWDNSSSGYSRNNKIIRSWTHAWENQIVIKGNNTNESYGNVFVWTNLLTPNGNSTEFNNLKDLRFVGIDGESWNFNNLGSRALLYMRNMGNVKLGVPSGGHNGSYKTPVFDIEADNLFILGKRISVGSSYGSIARANTNVMTINSNSDPYTLESGSGYDFRAFFNGTNVTYNGGSNITSAITGDTADKLKATILDEELTPWDRPTWETLPNPLGDNWDYDLEGKEDSSDYIQDLIDTNNFADLPEGIYYISKTIHITVTPTQSQGLVGAGTGKTVIVGMTDDFPLIKVSGQQPAGGFTLAHMTLQGGSTGLEITKSSGDVQFQVNNCNLRYLVFRNQTNGIHLYETWGLDNNFFDNVSFVNCTTGFRQTPDPAYSGGETNIMTYADKNVFYKSQVINCGTGFRMRTARADNLNAWVDCKFEENETAVNLNNHNYPFFANCDFTGHTGTYAVIADSRPAFYSCKFYDNSTTRIIDTNSPYVEGSEFLDNLPVFSTGTTDAYILNSTFVGDVGGFTQGMVINSNMQSNSNLNKLMVKVVSSTPTTLLDEEPDPYPQLLVKH